MDTVCRSVDFAMSLSLSPSLSLTLFPHNTVRILT